MPSRSITLTMSSTEFTTNSDARSASFARSVAVMSCTVPTTRTGWPSAPKDTSLRPWMSCTLPSGQQTR